MNLTVGAEGQLNKHKSEGVTGDLEPGFVVCGVDAGVPQVAREMEELEYWVDNELLQKLRHVLQVEDDICNEHNMNLELPRWR